MPVDLPIPDPELAALLQAVRDRAAESLAALRAMDRAGLTPDAQAAYDTTRRQFEAMLRLTDNDVLAAITDAIVHADRELDVAEIMALLTRP